MADRVLRLLAEGGDSSVMGLMQGVGVSASTLSTVEGLGLISSSADDFGEVTLALTGRGLHWNVKHELIEATPICRVPVLDIADCDSKLAIVCECLRTGWRPVPGAAQHLTIMVLLWNSSQS